MRDTMNTSVYHKVPLVQATGTPLYTAVRAATVRYHNYIIIPSMCLSAKHVRYLTV